jgi:hypothetical protein
MEVNGLKVGGGMVEKLLGDRTSNQWARSSNPLASMN